MKPAGGFMSEVFQYMKASIRNYLNGCLDVDDFRAEIAGAYFYARNNKKQEGAANLLASRVIGPVAEFSGGYRSEASLRLELVKAVPLFDDSLRQLTLDATDSAGFWGEVFPSKKAILSDMEITESWAPADLIIQWGSTAPVSPDVRLQA
jgi:hypothetical protein